MIVVIGILATISVVAYAGIQARSRAAVVTSALSQAKTKLEVYKVGNGTYPTTGDFSVVGLSNNSAIQYAYISTDGTAYCLTATNTTVTYGVTSTTTPTEGGCGDTSWLGNVVLTNMVTNGDLSQGATGWNVYRGTSRGIVDGGYSATGDGNNTGVQITYTATPNFILDRMYYRRATFRVSSAIAPNNVNFYAGSSLYTFAAAVTLNQWQTVSSVTTQPAGNLGTRYVSAAFLSTEQATAATLSVKNVVVIDLTAAFGAGNEPTKAQMDTMLQQFPGSYFSGTVGAGNV